MKNIKGFYDRFNRLLRAGEFGHRVKNNSDSFILGMRKFIIMEKFKIMNTYYEHIPLLYLIILVVYTHDLICCTNFYSNVATVKRRENIPRYEFSKCSTKLQEGMLCSMYIDILKRFARINSNCLFI